MSAISTIPCSTDILCSITSDSTDTATTEEQPKKADSTQQEQA
jgi:hypothetical protein